VIRHLVIRCLFLPPPLSSICSSVIRHLVIRCLFLPPPLSSICSSVIRLVPGGPLSLSSSSSSSSSELYPVGGPCSGMLGMVVGPAPPQLAVLSTEGCRTTCPELLSRATISVLWSRNCNLLKSLNRNQKCNQLRFRNRN
jgi:hypothetical protein